MINPNHRSRYQNQIKKIGNSTQDPGELYMGRSKSTITTPHQKRNQMMSNQNGDYSGPGESRNSSTPINNKDINSESKIFAPRKSILIHNPQQSFINQGAQGNSLKIVRRARKEKSQIQRRVIGLSMNDSNMQNFMIPMNKNQKFNSFKVNKPESKMSYTNLSQTINIATNPNSMKFQKNSLSSMEQTQQSNNESITALENPNSLTKLNIPLRQGRYRKSNFWNKPKELLTERIQILKAEKTDENISGKNSIHRERQILKEIDQIQKRDSINHVLPEKSLQEDFSPQNANSIIENSVKLGQDPTNQVQKVYKGRKNFTLYSKNNMNGVTSVDNSSLRQIEGNFQNFNVVSPSEKPNLNPHLIGVQQDFDSKPNSHKNSINDRYLNNRPRRKSRRITTQNSNEDYRPYGKRSRTTSFYNNRSVNPSKKNDEFGNFNRGQTHNPHLQNNVVKGIEISNAFLDDFNEAKLQEQDYPIGKIGNIGNQSSRQNGEYTDRYRHMNNTVLHPMNFNGKHVIRSSTSLSSSDGELSSPPDSTYTRVVSKYQSPGKMSRNSKNSGFADSSNVKNKNPAIRRLQTKSNLMNSTQSQHLSRSIFVPRDEMEAVNKNKVDGYKVTMKLGSGSFANVYKGRHEKTNRIVAIKIMNKKKHDVITKKEGLDVKIADEIMIHKKLKHKNVVKTYQIIETSKQVSIIMENAKLKGLFSHKFWKAFNKKNKFEVKNKIVGLEHSRYLFKQILEGLQYMHDERVAHRDFKPQNILVNSDMTLKICDFGISKFYDSLEEVSESDIIGTIAFHSPEMYNSNDGYCPFKGDIWAAGIIFYHMLFGKYPIEIKKKETFIEQLITLNMNFKETDDSMCKDILKACLDPNPEKRYSATKLLTLPFFMTRKMRKTFNILPDMKNE